MLFILLFASRPDSREDKSLSASAEMIKKFEGPLLFSKTAYFGN